MPFDALNKLKNPISTLQEATETVASLGMEKTREVLAQVNLLLLLLQSAGYGVGNLDIELSLPPKVTIKLKTGPAVKEERLAAILREQADKKMVAGIVASLIQANKLRDSVTVETLELEEVQILLTTTPNITLQWKDKNDMRSAAA
ncbi:MAG: hypothetical protein WBC78_00015 [Candidatus Sulfotelmatobacter sp.]